MRSPRSLRVRLVLVAVLLTLLGLAVAGVATYGALRSFLMDRVDVQLKEAPVPRGIRMSPGYSPDPIGSPKQPEKQRATGAVYDTDGHIVGEPPVGMPTFLDLRTGFQNVRIQGRPFRAYARDVSVTTPGEAGFTEARYVAVLPLADVHDTLNRLVLIEVLVGIAALAAAVLAGYALVRVGLQPLTDIEQTAGSIAAGDLSQRIADENPETEVGRLGRSLNVMLGQIEESFAEREASERRLRQFVADASHELQTPLTSVRGYAELFRRGAADRPEDLATAMRRIEAEAERMGVLVDDLLLLARLDQGRPLDDAPVDLVQLVRDQAGDLRVVAPDHPVTVTAPDAVRVRGDEVRLRQVVTNLLTNARTHTPPGTRVEVSVRRDGQDAVIVVSDDGPGIAAEHRERLFERFFRADPSRARASGGSGLGLSIVAAIAEAHGGSVSVGSPEGGGTAFMVRIPVGGAGADGSGAPTG